jgi:ethanolamine kinase
MKSITRRFDDKNHRHSAIELVSTALPGWIDNPDNIEIVRCTDGITNILLKVINHGDSATCMTTDDGSVLLRAYGAGTDIIIDREREIANHELLMRHGLAPPLIAKFENGIIYRFVPGIVAQPENIRTKRISLAIARQLARWHAVLPCQPHTQSHPVADRHEAREGESRHRPDTNQRLTSIYESKDHPDPTLWNVLSRWVSVLPTATPAEAARKQILESESQNVIREFEHRHGLGVNGVCQPE